MFKVLSGFNVPFALFGQYQVSTPGSQQPFLLDFAYPEIGVGIETDGKIWHEREDLQQRDQQRDQKLANMGWRILRFKEDAVDDHIDTIKDIIYKNITDAAKAAKKASDEGWFEKFASLTQYVDNLQGGLAKVPLNPQAYGFMRDFNTEFIKFASANPQIKTAIKVEDINPDPYIGYIGQTFTIGEPGV